MHTRLRKSHEIHADSLKLGTWHGNCSSILSIRDTQMLLINVHKLQVVLAQSIVGTALEDQVQHIGGVLSLEGKDIIVLGGTKDLGEGCEVDTKGDVAIASVGRETLCLEHHGDKGDVGVVHGLESDTRVIAVEVTVLN